MRRMLTMLLLACVGCVPLGTLPNDPPTMQVADMPFAETKKPMPRRASYAPAAREVSFRVELARAKLIDANPQLGLSPNVTAITSTDPEVFHTTLQQIFITDTLVRQCQNDGNLAAVLAQQLGRMVAEREATVADQVRQPERLLPIHLPIGNGTDSRESDPLKQIELARYEKQFPKSTARKLTPPNPHQVARLILERAGYQRTELDAALPLLQIAERFSVNEMQFKGSPKQNEWKMP